MTALHADLLEDAIRGACFAIAADYADSLDGPRPQTVGARPAPGSRMPIGAPVLDVRAQACARLAGWALLIIEERDLHTHLEGSDVVALCRFVETHAGWLAHHMAGPDASAELADSARKIATLVTGARIRRFWVGQCPAHDTSDLGERVECAGDLYAMLRSDDSLLPSAVRCSLDPLHEWSAHQWQGLGRLIHGAAGMNSDGVAELARRLAG